MTRYDSLEEALTGLANRLEELKKVFCPLTSSNCNFQCVCFKHPVIYERTFNVFQGGCNNKMFKDSYEAKNLLGPL